MKATNIQKIPNVKENARKINMRKTLNQNNSMEKTNMRKILNQKKNIKKKKFGENTEPKRENENNTYEKKS